MKLQFEKSITTNSLPYDGDIICIRGGGDLATGVIQKFSRAGKRVVVLEIQKPTAIRRTVALSTAIVTGTMQVEDITARHISYTSHNLEACWSNGEVPVIIDPNGTHIEEISPICVIDAILAKKNLGTNKCMAPITIGMGPGFFAPDEVDVAIETMRGHRLGRLIFQGTPLPNTGIPGALGGRSTERVLRAPGTGVMRHRREIGEFLKKGEVVFSVNEMDVSAPFDGILRGILERETEVFQGMKVGDIDPRELEEDACITISDKARALGGAALEAYLYMKRVKGL